MNKTELISSVAEKAGMSKSQAGNAIEAFMECVVDSLKGGDSVSLTGFGTFSVVERGERQGRNPRTGEPMTIKAKKVAKFKPGKGLSL